MRKRVTIGFSFSFDWTRKWREIFKPITDRRNAKPKQTQITFDTQVKTAPFVPMGFTLTLISHTLTFSATNFNPPLRKFYTAIRIRIQISPGDEKKIQNCYGKTLLIFYLEAKGANTPC